MNDRSPSKITFNLFEGRTGPDQREWEAPAWGSSLSKMVLPLFITSGDRYIPVGTAFWVGRKVSFVMTAMHNVHETLRHEGRWDHQLASGRLPPHLDLKAAGLCVLHQDEVTAENARFTITPLENLHGAPPTDVVIGYPSFVPDRATASLPLSFDVPRIGQTVWSIGYTDFEPASGIPMEAVRSGAFDWRTDYRHRLMVTEGRVERIFMQRFAAGFGDGPCFSFDNEIAHGQSGGPVVTEDGRIVGLNSSGATRFFDRPSSVAALLHPLVLTPVKFGLKMGPLAIRREARLIDLIFEGVIASDGSEQGLGFTQETPGGPVAISGRALTADRQFVHDDFAGYQADRLATRLEVPPVRHVPSSDREGD